MTFLLALFLTFTKRRDDVILYQNTGISPRKHTNRYNLDFLNQVLTVLSTAVIIAYIIYTLSPDNRLTVAFPDRNTYRLVVYGNSKGDKPLMEFADVSIFL
ncbi:MAG: hypothetical protein LBE91_17620 [Tannerella sp.]|jgi:hypothetical protein|nr:hypothetical protein [Tannerella sp.]